MCFDNVLIVLKVLTLTFVRRTDVMWNLNPTISIGEAPLKDLGTFCNTTHTMSTDLHQTSMFEDNDTGKRTLKYQMLRCCSF